MIRNGSGVCSSACEGVIDSECGENFWSFLTNIVEQLRQADIQLPALKQSSECGGASINDSGDMPEGCSLLQRGK